MRRAIVSFTKKHVMKTKQFALMLLAAVITVSAVATEIPKMDVVAVDNSRALVTAVPIQSGSTTISVVSENGKLLYHKKVKADSEFKTVLNLSKLEDGKYTIKLDAGKESVQQVIELNNSKINVKPVKREIEPFFSYKNDKLKFMYLNFDQTDMSMLVYKGAELIFRTDLGNDFNLKRSFDVSGLEKGELNFVLVGDEKVYSYNFQR